MSNSIIIAALSAILLLVLNPILTGSSFAQPGAPNDSQPPITLKDKQDFQITAPGNKNLKDKNIMVGEGNNQKGKFCIKGTGPGTSKACIPCDPNNGLQEMSECISPKGGTPSKDTPDIPKSYSSWFNSGVRELEADKKLPPGTGKALASFEQGDPTSLLNVCKSIAKVPGADVNTADCNSLTGKGEKAEETKLIIAGYTVGKLYEEAENNNPNPNSTKPTNSK